MMYDVIFKNGNVVDVKNEQILPGRYCSQRWKNRRNWSFSGRM